MVGGSELRGCSESDDGIGMGRRMEDGGGLELDKMRCAVFASLLTIPAARGPSKCGFECDCEVMVARVGLDWQIRQICRR